jgi:hypothetical protein
LLHTKSYELKITTNQSKSDPIFRLIGYSDSDWGGDLDTRRSTSGYYFSINNNPISWASKLQKSVALSSCEAEYIALKEATKEMLYLKEVLLKLDLPIKLEASIIYTDSKSAIELANNPEHHVRTKHIDIQYHFVREKVQNKEIILRFISTKEQIADILTKGINSVTFKNLVYKLGVAS